MHGSEEQELNCKIVAGAVNIKSVDDFLSVLKEISQKYVVTIQAMDAGLIAGEEHIKSAVNKAIRAVEKKKSITSDLSLEILLYAAGKRQIERALTMGVTEGKKKVAIVIVNATSKKDLGGIAEEVKRKTGIADAPIQDWELELELEDNEHKRAKLKKFFAIPEDELNAVGEKKLKMLVLERVALLDVLK
ncbi:MAG TPA: KEOPS complex subunit Cgi121 [Candidatus Bathyarchaeia archaeon]|nr:KEOPS complex subunit Cgi121 [Candidatus Bathyarchaeia archaeon]